MHRPRRESAPPGLMPTPHARRCTVRRDLPARRGRAPPAHTRRCTGPSALPRPQMRIHPVRGDAPFGHFEAGCDAEFTPQRSNAPTVRRGRSDWRASARTRRDAPIDGTNARIVTLSTPRARRCTRRDGCTHEPARVQSAHPQRCTSHQHLHTPGIFRPFRTREGAAALALITAGQGGFGLCTQRCTAAGRDPPSRLEGQRAHAERTVTEDRDVRTRGE